MKYRIALSILLGLLSENARAQPWLETLDGWMWGGATQSARSHYAEGEFDKAAEAFEAAANSRPASQDRQYNAGVAAYRADDKEAALRYFQQAAQGEDLEIRAKALANEALVHIEKQDLKTAHSRLRDALSYDNDNKAIQENLAWVEQQLKQQNPEDQKQDQEKQEEEAQEQTAQDQQKNQSQASDEQKAEKAQEKQAQEQSAQKEQGQQQNADKTEDQQNQGASEQKTAEQKSAEAAAEQQADKEQGEKQAAAATQQAKKTEEESGDASQDQARMASPGQGSPEATIMTPAELQRQEAERMLRSIDDKIGRYPLIDTEATGDKGKNDKNW